MDATARERALDLARGPLQEAFAERLFADPTAVRARLIMASGQDGSVTVSSSASAAPADLWQHYGTRPPEGDRPRDVDARMYWDWYQRTGPGAELLGDVAGRTVAELGAGVGRQAAHIAHTLAPAQVLAIDNAPTQHTRGRALYGHVQGLEFIEAEAVTYLGEHPHSVDLAYSLFGALDFTDPQTTLPAITTALRPGGRLVLSTLAHYSNGAPPETACRPAHIPTRRGDGNTMQRWVLDLPVWEKLLAEHGFTTLRAETLHDPGDDRPQPMATRVICARMAI
ncbi:class I SAM-dependent methyltransferase [Streptomyces sp. NBC_00344]|uniref:class I SAM-dependent methyltransferase n=1 Tax=Streptomyces sp. NBC_00344 TaxID=2975720 RepID=UPI002E2429D9